MLHEYSKIIKRADDEAVALRVKITSADTTGTITLATNTSLAYNIDGSSATIDLTTTAYNTLGEVADYLNAIDDIEAVIVDGRRANSINATTTTATTSAQNATGTNGMTILWDTSLAGFQSISIQEEDLPSLAATSGSSDVSDDGIENQAFRVKGTVTHSSATNTLNVYKCHGTTETLIQSIDGTATSTEQTLFSDDVIPITAADPQVGARLVCEHVHQTGGGSLQVRGKSINRARQAIDG